MQNSVTDVNNKKQYSNLLGTIAKQSHWVFIGKIIFTFLGFGIRILLARILRPASLRKYQLNLTIIEIATIFSVLGLDRGLVRYLPLMDAKKGNNGRKLFILSINISLALSFIFTCVLYFFSSQISSYFFHSEEMSYVIKLFSFYLPVFTILRVASGGINGIKRVDVLSNVTNVLCPLSFILSLATIFLLKRSLIDCVIARTVTHMFGVVVLIYFLLKNLPRGDKSSKGDIIGTNSFLSYSSSLMFIGLIYYLLNHMDILMLGYFMEESDVGVYSVAIKVAIFIIFGLQVLLPIVSPYISELSTHKDSTSLTMLFGTTTKWIFYSGLFIFCLLAILRIEVLNVFGAQFAIGGNILLILGVGNLVNAASGPTGQLLVMTGKQKWEMLNTILLIILNFLLNLFLIPRFGTAGAAMATAIAISLINIAKLIEVYFSYGIHPYNLKYIKGIMAVLIGSLVCYFTRLWLLELELESYSIILISITVYCFCTFACIWFLGIGEDKVFFDILKHRKQKDS